MKPRGNNTGPDDFVCSENPRPLIEEGRVETQVTKIESRPYFGKERRLYLHHKITSFGPNNGLTLFESINATYETFGLGTKYYNQWKVANYGKAPSKGQKMPTKIFLNKIFLCKVRTVKAKSGDRYSVIDSIIQVVAPDEPSTFTSTFTNTVSNTNAGTSTGTSTNTKRPCIRRERNK